MHSVLMTYPSYDQFISSCLVVRFSSGTKNIEESWIFYLNDISVESIEIVRWCSIRIQQFPTNVSQCDS